MRFYNRQHRHDCGIDLHVETMYVCIRDESHSLRQEQKRQDRLAQNRESLTRWPAPPVLRLSGHDAVDLAFLERYDTLINDLELTLVRTAKQHDADAFHRLRSVPGIGKVLALTILYEIHDIARFDRVQEFASYARLVKGRKQAGGKMLGASGAKMGNVHLKWAFFEAECSFSDRPRAGRNF